MEQNKLEVVTNLFEGNEIRSIWDADKEDYFFSVVDVIGALVKNKIPRNYWSDLKRRLKEEGSELHGNIVQLKMRAQDGKMRETDTLDTKGIFRLIESVPSKKAEPFKLWLANLGSERVDEIFDPEKAITRAINYYKAKGYSKNWIEARIKAILNRNDLTDLWASLGIDSKYEYALLTNEIYQTWSGMKASEYKEYKGIRKESLRDNMTRIEVLLTDLGETATHDIAEVEQPKGFKENMRVAKRGGKVAKGARDIYEKETGHLAISKENSLPYKYVDEKLLKDNKK